MEGKKFGKLTVIEKTRNAQGLILWYCVCECGEYKKVRTGHLNNGSVMSCGCAHRKIIIEDYIGKKFSSLLVIRQSQNLDKRGNVLFKCLCDCGNIVELTSSQLKLKTKKGCSKTCPHTHDQINITGQYFGKLKVVEKVFGNNILWKCVCVCGKKVLCKYFKLLAGKMKSCGCSARLSGKDNHFYKHGQYNTPAYQSMVHFTRKTQMKENGYHKVTQTQLDSKFESLGNICIYCCEKAKLTVDHLLPISKGGPHTLSNLLPACHSCNSSKGNRLLFTEWMPKKVHPYLLPFYIRHLSEELQKKINFSQFLK